VSYVDLTCRESVSLLNGNFFYKNRSDHLHLGCGFITYLFFELPLPSFIGRLEKAELVLYKIPADTNELPYSPECDRYFIYLLLDYFNIFGNCYEPPRIDECLGVEFIDHARIGYDDVDITKIVEAWLGSGPENKGLLLTGTPDARRLVYASDRFEAPGMRPMLRLTYEGVTRPLNVAPCTVEVK
jgi:hypothetical protein